jgi:hydroxyethylthiazole kinase-like uncharacterized protein yjeF
MTANEPALWRELFPVPRPDGHKYDRGHAVVVSGDLTGSSAARLAARAALRAGAGLVTLASPRDALAVNAAASLSVMVRLAGDTRQLSNLLSDRRVSVVVVGPGYGVGLKTRKTVLTVLKSAAAVVLDADALTSLEKHPEHLFKAVADRKPATILTPHEGEFKRLFNKITENPKLNSKVEQTLTAASISNAVVVFKGPDTVVASPDGRVAIAHNAPPWLATAGAGDVLAGMIAGLAAQRMPAFEAASAGVWLHGEAANAFGPGLIAEDLPEALPGVLRRLLAI